MRVGYACLNITLQTKMRTCRLATVEKEGMSKLKELTLTNLSSLINILEWNIAHGILFFRISSDIVPFGSHPVLTWEWWKDEDVLEKANQILRIQQEHQLRLSAHPGQYTLINSPNMDVVHRSVLDLLYHDRLLDVVGAKDMIIHTGGAYGDKPSAIKRFIEQYMQLPRSVKDKLRLENDDKVFEANDVLSISDSCGVPICFDIHHHHCNNFGAGNTKQIVERAIATWKHIGKPKMHISSGRTGKTDPAHHDYVAKSDWDSFLELIGETEVDMMVEAKKKELAVLRLREEEEHD